MKNALAAIVVSLSACAWSSPSADNYASVTNDWFQGNWTNVYELAQLRLAANTNDLVASHLMVSYDILFSDYQSISNSIQRLLVAMDSVTEPSMTNLSRSSGSAPSSCRSRPRLFFRSSGRSRRFRTSRSTATSFLSRYPRRGYGRR